MAALVSRGEKESELAEVVVGAWGRQASEFSLKGIIKAM